MVRHILNSHIFKKFTSFFKSSSQNYMTTLNAIFNMTDATVLNPYERSVWTYACIKTIADNISRTPYCLNSTSTRGKKKEVLEGPLVDVLTNPNQYMIDAELFENTFSWYLYRGEAMWILDRDSILEVPKAIYTFDPTLMEPVLTEDNTRLLGWNYYAGGKVYFFTEKNVVHFRMFNPTSELRGFSPTIPAQSSIDQEYLSGLYNKAFFQNGGAVSGWLFVKEEMSDESYKRLLATFNDRHVGGNARKAHRIGILEGGVDFKPTNMSHKDMDFANLKSATKKEILVSYKMSEVVLGEYSDIKSYEGINAAHRTFWHECLLPKVRYCERVINNKFLKTIDPRIKFSFDISKIEALKEDLRAKLEMSRDFINLGYTPNQINERLELGMPENPWGDYAFFNKNKIPVGSIQDLEKFQSIGVGTGGNQASSEETSASSNTSNTSKAFLRATESIASLANKYAEKQKEAEEQQKILKGIWDKLQSRISPIEEAFRGKIKQFFFNQRKADIVDLYSKGEILSKADREVLVGIFSNFYSKCIKEGRECVSSKAVEIEQPVCDELIKERVFVVDQLMQTFDESLMIAKDASTDKEVTIKAVKQAYNSLLNYSIPAIVRYETQGIFNKAIAFELSMQGLEPSGVLSQNADGEIMLTVGTVSQKSVEECFEESADQALSDGIVEKLERSFLVYLPK